MVTRATTTAGGGPGPDARATEGAPRRTGKGEGCVLLTASALLVMIAMVFAVVLLLLVNGLGFFWPGELQALATAGGERYLGQEWHSERIPGAFREDGEPRTRTQFRLGNPRAFAAEFIWIDDDQIVSRSLPADALLLETLSDTPRIGYLAALLRDGEVVAEGSAAVSGGLLADLVAEARAERDGARVPDLEHASLTARLRLVHGAAEQEVEIPLAAVVRAVTPNRLGLLGKARVYAGRIVEFLAAHPRESNTAGGVLPAILGTVLMVLIMVIAVVPLGVVGALYLNEYARQGPLVRLVRLAVSNLAGVPSIVFGMFGLAFFVYVVGDAVDAALFPGRSEATFGKGGLLWASLTLALLTVPVVIVSTEEALRATPRAQREGSLALGATKWQTLRTVILPQALPGILTGIVLAIARGAGEVAPLMLTGVMKLAPSPLFDGTPPFLHLDRKFMHLGFHIYDVGFQSPNVEASKPIVYATAFLLLVLVVALNLAAILFRNRVRRRLRGGAFA